MFQHTGADEEKLRSEFRILGYNASMKFESGRAAVLSVHGTVDFSMETIVFDAAAYEEAVELPAKVHGECSTFEDGELDRILMKCCGCVRGRCKGNVTSKTFILSQ